IKLFFDTDWMAILTQWTVSLWIILVVKRCFATRTHQPTSYLMKQTLRVVCHFHHFPV
ncbi:hypothetical protein BC941DRAFT_433030, partial [Chlamydoabsidia padenii]